MGLFNFKIMEKRFCTEFSPGGRHGKRGISYARSSQGQNLALHKHSFMNLMMIRMEERFYTESDRKGVN